MTADTLVDPTGGPFRESAAKRPFYCRIEDALLSLALAAMVLIPLIEIVLRASVRGGIQGAGALTQHLSLVVAMVGGAIAARERRLLSLSSADTLLPPVLRSAARMFSGAVAAGISLCLCIAGIQFVVAESENGKILAYHIPVWAAEALLPFGFAILVLRLLWHSSARWKGRAIAALLVVITGLVAIKPPLQPSTLVVPAMIVLLIATLAGAPVFTTLGGIALILFWGARIPIAALPVAQYSLVTNPSLPTIPLFTLAGYFLAEGGASKRLVAVFQALFGNFHGGPAIVTVLVCAFFTTFTGASGVTILALGGLLMPVLLAAHYSEKTALGLLTSAGSLGLLFPPCLPIILYAIISKTTMKQMFLGGIFPGLLMVGMTAWWGVLQGPKVAPGRRSFDKAAAARALWRAKWELLLPVVAFAALFSGLATPVEASAVTALYAFIVETFIYRDFRSPKEVIAVGTECGLVVGGVLLILGVALGFTNYLVDAEIPARAVAWVTASIHSRYLFLLLLNLFLLVVGCLMDIFSAIVIVVPIIVPIGAAFNIDPVHLGIIFLANLELGFLTPPVGMNLFLSSYRFKKPLSEVCRSIVPPLLVLLCAVLLITYIPPLTTTLPRWLGN
ncbi:MAG TPA: TRAP transporter large permease subunit [Acidobacteriota bacterium]|jgi:tripartite ATP-independent transporter DctM subunit